MLSKVILSRVFFFLLYFAFPNIFRTDRCTTRGIAKQLFMQASYTLRLQHLNKMTTIKVPCLPVARNSDTVQNSAMPQEKRQQEQGKAPEVERRLEQGGKAISVVWRWRQSRTAD
jgi:hypothetical protein